MGKPTGQAGVMIEKTMTAIVFLVAVASLHVHRFDADVAECLFARYFLGQVTNWKSFGRSL